ncbi:FAD-dependent oxidoreductase [Dactylosporangium sp. NPDC051485]|uniref:NAD(P)/FAD-dependent oxidoreductase n=1 Tax=Dactylosporangium sp. NPDC051485 TaxID=3154846 RepID=UPI0034498A8F
MAEPSRHGDAGERNGIAIVGGSVAGVAAADAARRAGYQGPVWLVEAQPHEPYDRPPLSKQALSPAAAADSAELTSYRLREPQHWRRLGITLRTGVAATSLDVAARRIRLADGTQYACQAIVLAPGAEPRPLPFPVDDAPVHVLRGLGDARALAAALRRARRLLVIGAGFIGLEVASAARAHGVDVTVVEIAPAPLAPLIGIPAADYLLARHQAAGTAISCGRSVHAVRRQGAALVAVLDDGTELSADTVVAGIGVRPATDWLHGSGIELTDGIVADERLRAGADGIYACGDAVRWTNPLYGQAMRIEHWTTAREQGERAGANAALFAMTGQPGQVFTHVPYVWSDQLGLKLQFVGRRLPGSATVVERSDEGGHVSTHWLDGRLIGCTAVNSPKDAMLARRTIQTQCLQERPSAPATSPPEPGLAAGHQRR